MAVKQAEVGMSVRAWISGSLQEDIRSGDHLITKNKSMLLCGMRGVLYLRMSPEPIEVAHRSLGTSCQ